jgi:hypothetical protein
MLYKHMLMGSIKTPKILQSKTNVFLILLVIIFLYSLSSLVGLTSPFLIGFFFVTLFPGYLISSIFFSDRLTRLAFSPAISVSIIILPVILLNNMLAIPISKTNVIVISTIVFLSSSILWYKLSKKVTKTRVPRLLVLIALFSVLAIGLPAALNGTFSERGIRYGGNFDNDPWMQQAYANRILIENDLPVHDPYVSEVEEPRFYHYGLHVYLATFHYFTDLRIFQTIQVITFFIPIFFVISGYVFLRKFLEERSSLLITFLFVFAGGFGGILLLLQVLTFLGQTPISSMTDFMISNNEIFRCPFGLCPYDILYINNLPSSLMFITQSAGFMLALTVFPLLYLLVSPKGFDRKTKLLAGVLIASSFIIHVIFSIIILMVFVLYIILEFIFIGISKKKVANLIDIFLVFLVLYIPYYLHANLLVSSRLPNTGFVAFLQGSVFIQTLLGFGIAFIFGIPFLFYILKEKRSHFNLFLLAFFIITILLLTHALPIEPGAIRNYSVRLIFIPIFIGFGLFLERINIKKHIPIFVVLLIFLSSSNIVNSAAYYYVVLTDKDTISHNEWEALEWIRSSTDPNSVFLNSEYEVGPFSKISTFTGRRVFVGGTVVLYFNETESGRLKQDVDRIYNTTDMQIAINLLDEHEIEYVYIGSNERKLYPQGLEKFESLEAVFRNEDVVIFKYP